MSGSFSGIAFHTFILLHCLISVLLRSVLVWEKYDDDEVCGQQWSRARSVYIACLPGHYTRPTPRVLYRSTADLPRRSRSIGRYGPTTDIILDSVHVLTFCIASVDRWFFDRNGPVPCVFCSGCRDKRGRLKMRDMNLRHQFARVEIAGHENAGPICRGGKSGKS